MLAEVVCIQRELAQENESVFLPQVAIFLFIVFLLILLRVGSDGLHGCHLYASFYFIGITYW